MINEKEMRQNLYAAVALNCQGVSDLDLSRAYLCVIQNGDARNMDFEEPFASLFEVNGRMHEETKQAFLAYVDNHFDTE